MLTLSTAASGQGERGAKERRREKEQLRGNGTFLYSTVRLCPTCEKVVEYLAGRRKGFSTC
jgi:hypothetical protein